MGLIIGIDAFSAPEPIPLEPVSVDSIISSITVLFEFLSTLPHIADNAIHFPPPDTGWQGLNEEELVRRGRSERAIYVLKHLPCFKTSTPSDGHSRKNGAVALAPDVLSIAYHEGEVWSQTVHDRCSTPGDVVYLGKAERWDDTSLLLDVSTGTITEFSLQPQYNPAISFEDRETLARAAQWMAHCTWSVDAYAKELRRHYEWLVFMPVPTLSGMDTPQNAEWHVCCKYGGAIYDSYDLASGDEDYPGSTIEQAEVSDIDGQSDIEDDFSIHADEDYYMENEDMIIQEAELVALLAEAGPDGTRDNSLDTARVLSRPIHSTDSGSNFTSEKQMRLDQRNAALTEIYHHHGWPRRDFDKSRCIETLLTWASDERLRRVTRQ